MWRVLLAALALFGGGAADGGFYRMLGVDPDASPKEIKRACEKGGSLRGPPGAP